MMSTIDEEAGFEFAAMVEESEKQMRNMYASLPGQICAAVADTLTRTGRVKELAQQIEAQERANNNAVRASERVLAGINKLKWVALALILIMPLVVAVTFYVQRYVLNSEISELKNHIQGLQTMAANLKPNNPDGIELVNYGDGKKGIILPKGALFEHSGTIPDGREGIVFTP